MIKLKPVLETCDLDGYDHTRVFELLAQLGYEFYNGSMLDIWMEDLTFDEFPPEGDYELKQDELGKILRKYSEGHDEFLLWMIW